MTALVQAIKEYLECPMAEAILGGLLTSTFLNMVLVPVLFARWGSASESAS